MTTRFQSDPLERRYGQYRQSGGCFLVHTETLYVPSEKILKLKSLLLEGLEFNNAFKTNNSSSQEANDLLPLLELEVIQLSQNLKMYQTTLLDMLLSR